MAIPSIHTTGRFMLTNPFLAKPNVVYTVIALREIRDLTIKGINVYDEFYKSAGLLDGVTINGAVFNYADEVVLSPVIVTLQGTDNTVMYVPSTFIEAFPESGDTVYSRLVLSVDLGALPDSVNVDSILTDLDELVSARFGVRALVRINQIASENQPTSEEHALLEASRIGSIKETTNNFVELIKVRATNELLTSKIEVMTRILVENKLI